MFADDSKFNLLNEISINNIYKLLIPEPYVGKALIWLYDKFENNSSPYKSFKESDIHEALRLMDNPDLVNNLKEKYNDKISELQEYFLRFDKDTHQYSFQYHGIQFFDFISRTLKKYFNPTKIEIIYKDLLQKLEKCDSETEILNWFSIHFDAFKPELRNQLDYLDKQINKSVVEFRQNRKLNLQEGDILEILEQIDEKFDTIRKQNSDLGNAFLITDKIREILNTCAVKFNTDAVHNQVHDATIYFQQIQSQLNNIDKQLDFIHPRIRQLFKNLNKPFFYKKFDKFLAYVIDNSYEDTSQKNKILLPENIPAISIHSRISRFTVIERKTSLFPTRAKKRIVAQEDIALKDKAFVDSINKIKEQHEIDKWLKIIENDVQNNGEIELSQYFFKIFNQENDSLSLSLAINVIYESIKHFEQIVGYTVTIDPDSFKSWPGIKTKIFELWIRKN